MIKLLLIGSGIGLGYVAILWLLAIILSGFGEGTNLFLYSGISPFGFLDCTPLKFIALIGGIAFWPIIFSLVMTGNWRLITIFLLLIHYIGIAFIVLHSINNESSYVIKVWDQRPIVFISWIVIYLAGQIFLWYKILSPGIRNLFKIG